jgi:hypothetical protein
MLENGSKQKLQGKPHFLMERMLARTFPIWR